MGSAPNCMYLTSRVPLTEWVTDVVEMPDVEIIDLDVILSVVVASCTYVECG